MPEQIEIVVPSEHSGGRRQVIKKRIIKTRSGTKETVTEIVTKHFEGDVAPIISSVKEIEVPLEEVYERTDALKKVLKNACVINVEELPEKVEITEIQTLKGPQKITKKTRTITKRDDKEKIVTQIVQEETPGESPVFKVQEIELPLEDVLELKSPEEHKEKARVVLIEELPEHIEITKVVTEQGPILVTKKTRTIKKRADKQETVTKIVTEQIEGKAPVTSVTEAVTPWTEEETDSLLFMKPQKEKAEITMEELPEQIKVTETETLKGPQKVTKKTRTIRKREGKTDTFTQIIQEQTEDLTPVTTVKVIELPVVEEDSIKEFPEFKMQKTKIRPIIVEELPDQVEVFTIHSEKGPKEIIKKTRVIRKREGKKQTMTQIVQEQVQGEAAKAATVTEIEIPFEESEILPTFKLHKDKASVGTTEELPEQIDIFIVQTETGPQEVTKKTRTIKRKQDKQETVTQIIVQTQEGKAPVTSVTEMIMPMIDQEYIDELPSFKKHVTKARIITDEFPEKVEVFELETLQGPEEVTKKTRTIKKHEGNKETLTQIVTHQREGQLPVMIVKDIEICLDEESVDQIPTFKVPKTKAYVITEELPMKVEVVEVQTVQGPETVTKKTRTIKKKDEKKQVLTQFIEEHRSGMTPIINSISEIEMPLDEIVEKLPEFKQFKNKANVVVQELPETVEITEIFTKDGPKLITKRTKIVKRKDGEKETITETVTEQKSGKAPQVTTVTEIEIPIEEEIDLFPVLKKHTAKAKVVSTEELPEHVEVTQIQTMHGPEKVTRKTRTIKQKENKKEIVTQIVREERTGQRPVLTVQTMEYTVDEESIDELPEFKKHIAKAKVSCTEELPNQIEIIHIETQNGPQMVTKKTRTIKKKDGKKELVTQIITEQKTGEIPVIQKILEMTIPVAEEGSLDEFPAFKSHKTKAKSFIVEELPGQVEVLTVQTETGPEEVTKKTRTIKKKAGRKESITQIVTQGKLGQEPVSSVIEIILPFDEVCEDLPALIKKLAKAKLIQSTTDLKGADEFKPDLAELLMDFISKTKLPETVLEEKPVTKQKIIKKKKTKDIDEVTQRLLDLEVQKTELQEYEKIDVDFAKRERSQSAEPTQTHELPEKVQIIESQSVDGTINKHVIKKRVIKKRKGDNQQVTEIVTRQVNDEAPVTSINIIDELVPEFDFSAENAQVLITEEHPETVEVIETPTLEGPTKKTIVKKRLIKKRKGDKHEVTQVTITEEEGQAPTTRVEVIEETAKSLKPSEELIHLPKEVVEELPEHIQIIETPTKEGTKKTIVKKRTIKKHKGDKEEITEILTKQEEGEAPQTLVTISEVQNFAFEPEEMQPVPLLPLEIKQKKPKIKKENNVDQVTDGFKSELGQLLVEFIQKSVPEESTSEEPETLQEVTVTKDGQPSKKVVKRKVIKKKQITPNDDQNIRRLLELEVTKTPLEEFEKIDVDLLKRERSASIEPRVVEKLPEKVQIVETKTPEGKIKKEVIKKKVIKKKFGDKQEVTEIVTKQIDNEAPLTSITVHEEIIAPLADSAIEFKKSDESIEELPERIQVIETPAEEGPSKKTVIKKRVIRKKIGNKEEITEILTKQIEGEAPETLVTVSEVQEPEFKEVVPLRPVSKPPRLQKRQSILEEDAPHVELLQEFIQRLEEPEETPLDKLQENAPVAEEGTPQKKVVKRRIIKKKHEQDKEILRLLELEIEKTPLEQAEKHDFEFPKKQKPEKIFPEMVKFVRISIPKKVTVVQTPEEHTSTVNLKKIDSKQRPDVGRVTLEDVKLKGLQQEVEMPSILQKPEKTVVDSKPQQAVLERVESDEEAPKKMKKVKKIKTGKQEKVELEQYVKASSESEEEKPIEDSEKQKYQRVPKFQKSEPEEEKPLKLGKGKSKTKKEEVPESVELKKIPRKIREEQLPEETTQKKPKSSSDESGKKKTRKYPKLEPFEGQDYPSSEQSEDEIKSPEITEEVPIYEHPHKVKRPRVKKNKPVPEVDESILKLGIPKPSESPEPDDIKLRYKQKPPPEEETPEIKLKPWTKPKEDEQKDTEQKYDLSLPSPEPKHYDSDDAEKTPGKKIRKVKKHKDKPKQDTPQQITEAVICNEEIPADETISSLPDTEQPGTECIKPVKVSKKIYLPETNITIELSEASPLIESSANDQEIPSKTVISSENTQQKHDTLQIPTQYANGKEETHSKNCMTQKHKIFTHM